MTVDMNTITLICDSRSVRQTYQLGEGGARLTDGVGGLTTAPLPFDTDVVLWSSHPPYGQVIDLMLDGWASRTPVDNALHALYVMARARPGEMRPPQIRLEGNARRTDLRWLIAALDADESQAEGDGSGNLYRIPVQLTLMQDRAAELAIRKSASQKRIKVVRMEGRAGSGRQITVGQKDTLASIARKYKAVGGVTALAKRNKLRRGAKLRPGQKLILP